jgi:Domain of Unknown Function (DUF1206).
MTDLRRTASLASAEAHGRSFVQSTTFEALARAGFVARGLVYAIIGVLALKLAFGHGGKLTNQQGALKTVAHQPFGTVLLVLVAIGLGGYCLWRLVRAAIGHGPEGSDTGFERLAAFASGLAYGALCALAIEILVSGHSGSSGSPKKATAGIFGWPGGTWIVGIAGVVMIAVALYQGYRGISHKFLEDSKVEQMKPVVKKWITRLGTIGHLARMVVFGLVGIFLVKAAIDYNPRQGAGPDGALAKLTHYSYGPLLLGVVAAGLIAFAVYSLSDARYRRI